MDTNNTAPEILHEAAKSGVRVSFHLTPMVLSFTLSLATAIILLIVWLVDKPSKAEVNQQIDLKQEPVITRIDDLRGRVDDFHQDFRDYVKLQNSSHH